MSSSSWAYTEAIYEDIKFNEAIEEKRPLCERDEDDNSVRCYLNELEDAENKLLQKKRADATNRSNKQEQQAAATNRSNEQRQQTGATSGSNKQEQQAVATNSGYKQK
jgi:hypothetical protein